MHIRPFFFLYMEKRKTTVISTTLGEVDINLLTFLMQRAKKRRRKKKNVLDRFQAVDCHPRKEL